MPTGRPCASTWEGEVDDHAGELLPDDVYAELVPGLPEEGESLGVFPSDPPTATGFSNGGAIPGFIAYLQHDPASGLISGGPQGSAGSPTSTTVSPSIPAKSPGLRV